MSSLFKKEVMVWLVIIVLRVCFVKIESQLVKSWVLKSNLSLMWLAITKWIVFKEYFGGGVIEVMIVLIVVGFIWIGRFKIVNL